MAAEVGEVAVEDLKPASPVMTPVKNPVENLADLLQLVETEVPDTEAVTLKLEELASVTASEGMTLREEMLNGGAYSIYCRAWLACCFSGVVDVPSPSEGAYKCRDAVLRAIYTLTAGNPEIIDEIGWQIISQALDKTNSEETHILALQIIRNVSIKSEDNRENFVWNLELVNPLVSIISKSKASSQLVQEWCSAVKALLLCDDDRIVYNRAPERKRVVARTRILPILAGYLNSKTISENEAALNAVVVLLGTMAVNEDFCLHIEAGNALPGINNIFRNFARNKTLMRNTISLLRYLCVNANIRDRCSAYILIRHVIDCINYYKKEKDIVDVGLSCVAMMTIKNACQVAQVVGKKGIDLIYQIMNENDSDITILKGALFTLRNISENTKAEIKEQIKEKFEAFLRQLLVNAPEVKDYYVSPLMRELGLKEAVTPEDEEDEEEQEEETQQVQVHDFLDGVLAEEQGE